MNATFPTDIPSSVGRPNRQFATTYWPVVRSAAFPGAQREEALTLLVKQYSPALHQFVRARFRMDIADADDVVQGFLLSKVVQCNLLESAASASGSFRALLCSSIFRYALDVRRREGAGKRIPKDRLVSLEEADEAGEAVEVFDNLFLRQVLVNAVQRLHQACAERDHSTAWSLFYHRILAPTLDLAEPRPFEDLADELGLVSAQEARNRLLTAKRIFKRELAAIVTEYSENSAEAEEELLELRRLLD